MPPGLVALTAIEQRSTEQAVHLVHGVGIAIVATGLDAKITSGDDDVALARIRHSIETSYRRKGEAVVAMNLAALDASLEHLVPLDWTSLDGPACLPAPEDRLAAAPEFVREVIGPMLERRGDALPVSALPCDGTWPVGTARWEKRNIAAAVPVW